MTAFHFFPISKALNPEEKRYIAGRTWACAKSPTGAHHWDCVSGEQPDLRIPSLYICLYCGRTRLNGN